jgi:hypothetical protein
MKLPKLLQSALWSYDISQMDTNHHQDKVIIIENVLNHGSWEQLKWLLQQYSLNDIKKVILAPNRGGWKEDVLNYWQKILSFKLPKKVIEQALFNLGPKIK